MSMGMSLSLGCYQALAQRQNLSQAQRLGLKQLLLMKQKFKHPEFSNPVKGLDGMKVAHKMLQEKNASGVLIGGLSEAVWSQRRTSEELYGHKDVDVAVLNSHFSLDKKFEGGVDWWLPYEGRITVGDVDSRIEGVEQRWYENGFEAILAFGMKQRDGWLEPGLYIPGREWVIDMREYEASAGVDTKVVEIDDEVLDAFRRRVEKRVKTRLPKCVREAFKGHVLDSHYSCSSQLPYSVELERFGMDTRVGINRFLGRYEKVAKVER